MFTPGMGPATVGLNGLELFVLTHPASVARPERLRVTGNEPHFLIMADSVTTDRTLDLGNAYGRNAQNAGIFDGPLTPHFVIVNHRWAPFHGPGLALLLAIPFLLAGTVGAKLALCLFAGLL